MIDFQTSPQDYKHWKLDFDGPVAYLTMDVNAEATLKPGYELKMNSYDLGVDIELYDAVQRLRFEHPEIKSVVMRSGKDRIFCAGANIRMLGKSSHAHKVNFCKFTNETRNSIEDASEHSHQRYISAVNGTAAGGGYELALATDYIMLIDDGSATVSLPEVPLLAVLPGTGGLTRVVDKRKVRRDRADIFCSIEEGARGQRAVDWRLVDESIKGSIFEEEVAKRAHAFAADSDRPSDAKGVTFTPLNRKIDGDRVQYDLIDIEINRSGRVATVTLKAPTDAAPADLAGAHAQGADFWPLALCRQFDDALLHLRTNETEIGTVIFKTSGNGSLIEAYEKLLEDNADDWLMREIILYWKRTLKRVDMTSRTLVTLIEPGSCFVGILAELIFAADRSYMLDGQIEGDDTPEAKIKLSAFNFAMMPMSNDLTRLETRFLGEPETVERVKAMIGQEINGAEANKLGLVTDAYDDIDWEEDVRLFLEERVGYSPDALTGMEANLRFAGPETMETKIFGRLTAWQNWIFQRPNAVADDGALKLYGTGTRPSYDFNRV
ncbi:2,3-epoxybenzoyl-CoA dihydrolase [Terasakiella pusilla]|uniref:2,3-epoxybenzoyl-CoA dihydrolase n=1 Tax=Terasakiella pusilla TaxID=64973 RepID=UPI0004905970|nr:2,3-epoxybenzoyl-CoA dihydrolase [Terasakiella pusilla]